jgi:DNA-binding NarL/FixJ family response regulator
MAAMTILPERRGADSRQWGRARRMRVLIVDDHELVREGLRATLSDRYEIVGAVATAAEAIADVRRTQPDVALVDLRLPDMTGDELCRVIREASPATAVVILTTYVSDETVRRALQAGAAAYVTKAAGLPELLTVLRRLEEGGGGADPIAAAQIVTQLHTLVARRMDAAPLTPQQESVLELAAQGMTNHEIGGRLFISESTVRFHLQKLKKKFDARSKTDLIARAIRAGAIAPAPEDDGPR